MMMMMMMNGVFPKIFPFLCCNRFFPKTNVNTTILQLFILDDRCHFNSVPFVGNFKDNFNCHSVFEVVNLLLLTGGMLEGVFC